MLDSRLMAWREPSVAGAVSLALIGTLLAACSPDGSNASKTSAETTPRPAETVAPEPLGLDCTITIRDDSADVIVNANRASIRLTTTINIDNATRRWWATNTRFLAGSAGGGSDMFTGNTHPLPTSTNDQYIYLKDLVENDRHFLMGINRVTGRLSAEWRLQNGDTRRWEGQCSPGEFAPPAERRF